MVIVDYSPFPGKMQRLNEYAALFMMSEWNNLEEYLGDDLVFSFYKRMVEKAEFARIVVPCLTKNQKAAVQYFNEGANAYEKGEIIPSISLLTVCIAASPEKDPVLPIAYMCRAAGILQLKQFGACLMDINRALQAEAHLTTKMSESAKRVLLEKKKLCITLLEQEKIRKICLQQREKSTEKSNSKDDDKTKKVSAAKEDKCSTKQPTSSDSQSKRRKNEENMQPDQQEKKTSSEIDEKLTNPNDEESTSPIDKLMNPNNENRFPLPFIANKNEMIRSASAKVKIHYSDTHGRHLVATEDIKPGEVLIVERSFASVLFPQFYKLCCRYCFVRCEALIPCPECLLGTYCSESCRQKAYDEFHRIECSILGTLVKLEVSGETHLALRLLLVATSQGTGLDSMMQDPTYKSVEPNLGPIEGEFSSGDYKHVHNLMDHYTLVPTNAGSEESTDVINRHYEVGILLYLLQQTTFFGVPEGDTSKVNRDELGAKILFAGNLLLKFLYLSSINYRPVKDLVEIPPRQATAENYCQISLIGYGLYTLHSLMNHSCDPNTLSVNHQNSMVCYATQPIAKGDQIFTHYNWDYTRYDQEIRRDLLQSNYRFICECEPCKGNWPLKRFQKDNKMIRINRQISEQKLKAMEQKLYCILEEERWTPTDEDVNFVIEFISVFYKCVRRPYYPFTVACEYLMLLLLKRGNAYHDAATDMGMS